MFDLKIHEPLEIFHGRTDAFTHCSELVEVRSEDLDRDRRSRPRQHVVDPMTDRLADGDVHSGDDGHAVPEFGHDLFHVADREIQPHVDFSGVHALSRLVQLGTARPPGCGYHRRVCQEHLLHAPAQLVGFHQTGTGHRNR